MWWPHFSFAASRGAALSSIHTTQETSRDGPPGAGCGGGNPKTLSYVERLADEPRLWDEAICDPPTVLALRMEGAGL